MAQTTASVFGCLENSLTVCAICGSEEFIRVDIVREESVDVAFRRVKWTESGPNIRRNRNNVRA